MYLCTLLNLYVAVLFFLLRILIDNGGSQVDEVSSSGDLPVHMAQLDMDILKYLIDKGADVKAQGRYLQSYLPVHLENYPNCYKLLY